MSEEEIIKEIKSLSPSEQACEGILDLYNKEKEKNKKLEEKIKSIEYSNLKFKCKDADNDIFVEEWEKPIWKKI